VTLIVLSALAIGFYFWMTPGATFQDLANFIQLPMFIAIAINAVISLQNYHKLAEGEVQQTSKTYNRLVENRIGKIDQLFLNHKHLDRLYYELYPELSDKMVTSKKKDKQRKDHNKPSHKQIRAEHGACSIIFQFMSEIFTQIQAETPVPINKTNLHYLANDGKMNGKVQDAVEWLQTFGKWCRSPTLRRHWNYFKDEHHPRFVVFMNEFYAY